MALHKDANPYTLSASSATVWAYQNLNINTNAVTEDLPTQVLVQNAGAIDIEVKFMDKTEGNADSRGGTRVLAGNSVIFEIEKEKDEKPYYRVGVKLVSGVIASAVYVNSLKYNLQRI